MTKQTIKTEQRSCDELGLCQSRKPACDGCDHATRKVFPFAPGVIDFGPKQQSSRQGRAWQASDFLGALALVAAAYFLAGYLL